SLPLLHRTGAWAALGRAPGRCTRRASGCPPDRTPAHQTQPARPRNGPNPPAPAPAPREQAAWVREVGRDRWVRNAASGIESHLPVKRNLFVSFACRAELGRASPPLRANVVNRATTEVLMTTDPATPEAAALGAAGQFLARAGAAVGDRLL